MSVFDSYTTKGCLKFYKTANDEEKINITININTNHVVDVNIYDGINEFLTKLLIKDYQNENTFKAKQEQEQEKEKLKAEKERVKYMKEIEKKKKGKRGNEGSSKATEA